MVSSLTADAQCSWRHMALLLMAVVTDKSKSLVILAQRLLSYFCWR